MSFGSSEFRERSCSEKPCSLMCVIALFCTYLPHVKILIQQLSTKMYSVFSSFVKVGAHFTWECKWISVFNFHFLVPIWMKFGKRYLQTGFFENRRRIGLSFPVAVNGITFILEPWNRMTYWKWRTLWSLCTAALTCHLHSCYFRNYTRRTSTAAGIFSR
jgi:hypothetical protein